MVLMERSCETCRDGIITRDSSGRVTCRLRRHWSYKCRDYDFKDWHSKDDTCKNCCWVVFRSHRLACSRDAELSCVNYHYWEPKKRDDCNDKPMRLFG